MKKTGRDQTFKQDVDGKFPIAFFEWIYKAEGSQNK